MFVNYKTKSINSKKEILELLKFIRNRPKDRIHWGRKPKDEYLGSLDVYIHEKDSVYEILVKPGLKGILYVFDRDGEEVHYFSPIIAAASMGKAHKIQRVKDILGIEPDDIGSAIPYIYKNKKYDGIGVQAYEYDLSHAYLQMIKYPLPDLNTCRMKTKLREGEIGFLTVGEDVRITYDYGKYVDFAFQQMESPYIKWATNLENKINKEKDDNLRNKLKSYYRFSVGCLQNSNPFWRATIVGRCNMLIRSLQDDDTIYCNTDSIVSARRRIDLETDKLFKWKLKHNGSIFKWQKGKMNYQWDLELPVYRGMIKRFIYRYNKTHKNKWDILKDSVDCPDLPLYEITEDLELKENKYEEN